jgi:2-iminobutanoate/2-iminopropanoate deaminase
MMAIGQKECLMILKASIIGLAALSLAIGAAHASAGDEARHYVPSAPPADAAKAPPFSNGVLVGNTFYVAGHIGMDPKTQKAATDVDTEAHLVLDAVKETLGHAGLTMDDLVSVTIYCTDLTLYDGFNAIYRTYFHGRYPARAFIGVNQLVRGARFEIAGTAVKPLK